MGFDSRRKVNTMTMERKLRVESLLLGLASLISFLDVFAAPKESDPGPWAAAILGILLLRRALVAVPQPGMVVASGWILTLLFVGESHGVLNLNDVVWIVLVVISGICFAFWERIEKRWTQRGSD